MDASGHETPDVMIRRGAGLIEAVVDDELVGLQIDNGVCYGFNPTATRIWALIAHPIALSTLCAALTAAYDVEPAACRQEVLDMLETLRADGLVNLTSLGAG